MSIDQVNKQKQYEEDQRKKQDQTKQKELLAELKQKDQNKYQKRVTRAEETRKVKAMSTVQKLTAERTELHQISEDEKNNKIRELLKQASDNGLDISENNTLLQQEINDELNRVFGPKIESDRVDLSKNSRINLSGRNQDSDEHNEINQKVGSYHASKKQKKTQQKNEYSLTNDQYNQDEAEDNLNLIKQKTVKNDIQNKKNDIKQQQLLQLKDVKQFASALTQYSLNKNPDLKYKLEQQKRHLLQRGMSTVEIDYMENKVGQVIKQHMLYDLKQKLIQFHMSKGASKQFQTESHLAFDGAGRQLEEMRANNTIKTDISGVNENLKHQAKQEISDFLYEEATSKLIKHAIGKITLEEFTEDLKKLQKIAASAGVTMSEQALSDKIINEIEHLGLFEFTKPDSGTNSYKEKKPEKIVTQEEILDDKLRYLYMMKALHPSIRHKVSLSYKMIKCKNGMIKLGIYTEEKEESLKKQGSFLAAKKYYDELESIFREEATLPSLSGEKYEILEKKKQFLLKRLKSINHELNPGEIDRLKQNKYREMYSVIKENLLQLKERASEQNYVFISKKVKEYNTIRLRLINEADIKDDHSQLEIHKIPTYNSINEAA